MIGFVVKENMTVTAQGYINQTNSTNSDKHEMKLCASVSSSGGQQGSVSCKTSGNDDSSAASSGGVIIGI